MYYRPCSDVLNTLLLSENVEAILFSGYTGERPGFVSAVTDFWRFNVCSVLVTCKIATGPLFVCKTRGLLSLTPQTFNMKKGNTITCRPLR